MHGTSRMGEQLQPAEEWLLYGTVGGVRPEHDPEYDRQLQREHGPRVRRAWALLERRSRSLRLALRSQSPQCKRAAACTGHPRAGHPVARPRRRGAGRPARRRSAAGSCSTGSGSCSGDCDPPGASYERPRADREHRAAEVAS